MHHAFVFVNLVWFPTVILADLVVEWLAAREKAMKPLGRKAYGSIGHLPSSRLGPGDHRITDGQARICTVKARDKHDTIIVQQKYDGSCCAVALLDGKLLPLTRSGNLAATSPFVQHHYFDQWVWQNEARFRAVLREGERLVGEWLALAHGTRYEINGSLEPFVAFDIMHTDQRMVFREFTERIGSGGACPFQTPQVVEFRPIAVEKAMAKVSNPWCRDEIEGVVYRVERRGKVDFLAKWVRPDKVDGCFLPEVSGKEAVWNWKPQ
jgi:hypothetical protein